MSQYGKTGTPRSSRDPDASNKAMNSKAVTVVANGKPVQTTLPCSLEQFLIAQHLLPRSVVVEFDGEAVAPSEFSQRLLHEGARMEIVKIVAGG
jgi:thiamine biosynthesis protein ThiS